MNALWYRRVRRARHPLEESPECGGNVCVGQVGAVHGVVWGDVSVESGEAEGGVGIVGGW